MSQYSLRLPTNSLSLRMKIILVTVAFIAIAVMATSKRSPVVSTVEASSPPTSNVTVPSSAGQTVTVTWTGTIPTLANATSDCTVLADTAAVDQHNSTVNVPAGLYNTVAAQFTFNIAWTPVVNSSTSDEILTVVGPGGSAVGSSDSGNPSETVRATNLGGGTYKIVACGFANAQPQPYTGTLTINTLAPPPPPQTSPNWRINYHGTCCEGNLAASGPASYLLLPVLVNGNKIKRSLDGGKTWIQKYPPANLSVPFGIEGDLNAWGDDVVYFGTELAQGVAAHSDDRGENWTVVQIPVAFVANDQSWSYLGPLSNLSPTQTEPYVLAGWYRIGSVALFSFDGGLTWPIQTPLVGNDGSGPEHVVCQQTAHNPTSPGDTRIPDVNFLNHKAGRHGAWGTDRKFYWTETVPGTPGNLYVCKTDNFGATWTGVKHPIAAGPGAGYVVTHAAFDNKGTLYVLHGNKLYVSFNQGESFAYVHTLPRFGNALRSDSGSDQFFVVNCGTIHIGLLEAGGGGTGNVWYLRGSGVDTASPTWDEELVDVVGNVRLDFMQIVIDGNGIPTISYTTPTREVTTASRNTPLAATPVNVALASNGSTAIASTTANNSRWPAASAINGERTGNNWGNGTGGWNDGTRGVYPDSLEVDFPTSEAINQINIFTLQNNWTTAGQPDLTTPATGEGILDFDVQYWNGTAWVTVPGGSVTGNDKAWRQFLFTAVTATKIRVVVNNSRNNYSRIVEVEAFGCPP